MNAPFPRRLLLPAGRQPRSERVRRLVDTMLGKVATLVLAAVALMLGIATFATLAGGLPKVAQPQRAFALVVANFVVLLLLGAVLAGRLTRVWVERHIRQFLAAYRDGIAPADMYDRVLAEVERPLIQMTLAATRGNQIKAAAMLGLNRNTLRKKIRDLEIPVVRGIA